MTDDRQRLYKTVARDAWMLRILEGHTGRAFVFWDDHHRRCEASEEDVRYVLARLVLEGTEVNASLDS